MTYCHTCTMSLADFLRFYDPFARPELFSATKGAVLSYTAARFFHTEVVETVKVESNPIHLEAI